LLFCGNRNPLIINQILCVNFSAGCKQGDAKAKRRGKIWLYVNRSG
jgi:hypothetical protein